MHFFLIILALPVLITAQKIEDAERVINDARRVFANKYNVANMNELEFDYDLASYAWSLHPRCLSTAALIADKNYEVIPIYFPKSGVEMAQFLGENLLINPGQTKIGFTHDQIHCGNIDYNMIFVLGPLNGPAHFKEGTPGSRCEEGRVNRNGLCAKK